MSLFSKYKRKKTKTRRTLRLPTDNSFAIINNNTLKQIIINLPKNLSHLETMYYFYMELGAIANPNLRFTYLKKKSKPQTPITHSLVQLNKKYIYLLNKANLKFTYHIVKETIDVYIPYTYLFINIDNAIHVLCIYSDLYLIKKSRRTKKFAGYSYTFLYTTPEEKKLRTESVKELEKKYGPFYQVPRYIIQLMERKLGYKFYNSIDPKKPVKIENLMNMIRYDINTSSIYQNYILGGKIIEPYAEIRYSVGYIFKHVNIIADMLELEPREKLEYYKKYIYEILCKKDTDRITFYDIYFGKFSENFICLMRVNNNIIKDDPRIMPYTFYLYTEGSNVFLKQNPKQLYLLKKRLAYTKYRIEEYLKPDKKVTLKDIDLFLGIKIINE